MKSTIRIIQNILIFAISCFLVASALKNWNGYSSTLDLLLAICLLLGNYWWLQAMNNLTEDGQGQYWRIVFWSKLSTKRECFTEQGWNCWLRLRYLTAALVLLVIGRGMV